MTQSRVKTWAPTLCQKRSKFSKLKDIIFTQHAGLDREEGEVGRLVSPHLVPDGGRVVRMGRGEPWHRQFFLVHSTALEQTTAYLFGRSGSAHQLMVESSQVVSMVGSQT